MCPIYDYVCEDCLKQYEVKVPLEKYDTKVKCPRCGKNMKKKITCASRVTIN